MAINLDVDSFIKFIADQGVEPPSKEVALVSLHKVRCTMAMNGTIDKSYGSESGRWLSERGLWHGIRWWLLDG